MKVTIAAVGRLKAGAERELAERYSERAAAAGRRLGLTFGLIEIAESRAAEAALRKEQEAAGLLAGLSPGAIVVALDETGKALTSRAFAEHIAKWRDSGAGELALAIGGPDGHGKALLDRASLVLALGPMTWPHQIVRSLIAEQLYRAVTILSGHPYHRD
jgi:23S rRNA (pseudouridine1915-N3)-methyltransferase